MAAPDKDTIYVDIDDEITTIIDKVHNSASRIVALVLPKRATVFQSVVNMKLVKRAADAAKKRVVLITTEANLMPLASAVGLHVAATPQSKPEVPSAAEPLAGDDDAVSEAEYTASNAGNRSIGELAQRSGHVIPTSGAEETVSLDDEEDGDASETADEEKPHKLKKDHTLKVPNFNKFRLRLFLGVILLAGLVVGLYYCAVVLPKAAIAITTNSSGLNVNMNLSLDTAAQKLDTTNMVAPAKSEQQQKTTTQQADATGEKNTGDAATGSITMTAQKCSGSGNPTTVPAGTGVSTNGLTFITQTDTSFHISGFSNGCGLFTANSSTPISAQSAGTKYNVSGATFTVASRSDVSATGSATGGTDNLVKVVAQADIDGAKQKLATQDVEAIKSTLEQQLRTDGMYPVVATFKAGDPVITTSANAGDAADTVTVTQAITYTMLGAKQDDLDSLITKSVGTQIDTKTQVILDDGLSKATITVGDTSGTATHIAVQTTATIGPDIDPMDVKKRSRGKKVGDIKAMINAVPGVTNVDVQLSPFWVSTVPSDLSKVTVTIDKAK